MEISEVVYSGELRTRAKHLASGNMLITDAPIDNQGKGEAFSPTDLMTTSLATCMLTVMGIACRNRNIDMNGASAKVTKIMAANPRRIAEIHIAITMPAVSYTSEQKVLLEQIARTCPVALSIHPNIVQNISFAYSNK